MDNSAHSEDASYVGGADYVAAQRNRAPQLLSISRSVAAYHLVHQRIDALLRGRDDVADRPVPGCPAWTIRQTVAHLTGVAQDIAAHNVAAKGTDSWAQAQVERLDGHSLDDLLDLWKQSIESATSTFALAPRESVCQLVFDTLIHEHDIRGALDEPGSRTGDPAFGAAMAFATTMGDQFIRHAALPALRLSTPTLGCVQLGDPHNAPGGLALDLSDFEALRTFGGRRSVGQLRALPWQGDPTDLLPAFTHQLPAFTNDGIRPPANDLIE
jgi:uncharacterized protein (TIGR03083 family)